MLLRTLLTPFSELSQSRILRCEHCSVYDILSNSYCFNIQGCFCHISLEKPWYSDLLSNHKAKTDRATKYFYSSARLCSKELGLCQSSEDSIHLLTKVNLSRAKCHDVVHDILEVFLEVSPCCHMTVLSSSWVSRFFEQLLFPRKYAGYPGLVGWA